MSIVTNNKLYNSRPLEKRTEQEELTYDFLEKCGIEFERIDHNEANTIESCHEIEKYLNSAICKNLFLNNSAKTSYYLLLMCGDKKFISKDLSKKIGSTRLSFASSEDLSRLLNLSPGSVSIMGLINDRTNNVNVLIDKDLLDVDFFCCHPCKNTSTLKFLTIDIINKFLPATGHTFTVVEM